MIKIRYHILRHTLVAAALLLPLTSHALSIGEITLKSAYAMPLEAHIMIPAHSHAELDSLSVTLASPAAYEAAGLIWEGKLRDISLSLRFNSDGNPYILVQSQQPINELTLSLLIEFNWQGGKTVKQFNILLSPTLPKPDSSKRNNPNVEATATEAETLISMPEPQLHETETQTSDISMMRRPTAKITNIAEGEYEYGPVLPGESLSQVATKFADKTSMSLNQRMNVLFQLNREAFASNKLGSLKAGYFLKFSEHFQGSSIQNDSSPLYEENVESPSQNGHIVRLQEVPGSKNEIGHLEERLQKTRGLVADYRKTNNELRQRLLNLEKQVANQANELGIILPEQMIGEPKQDEKQ